MKTPNVSEIYREARECEGEGARFLPRCRTLALALSHSRASRFFKTSKFQTRLRFSCENLAFLFLNKRARLEIASGPNGTP